MHFHQAHPLGLSSIPPSGDGAGPHSTISAEPEKDREPAQRATSGEQAPAPERGKSWQSEDVRGHRTGARPQRDTCPSRSPNFSMMLDSETMCFQGFYF